MMFHVLIRNELEKQRRTLVWPAVVIIPVGACCAMFMDMSIRYKDYLYGQALKKGITSWRMLMLENHNLLGWGVFMPLFIAILCSFIYNSEFNGNVWKKTMSMPVSKTGVYFSKWLTVLILSFIMICLNAAGLYVVGKISGFPEKFDLLPYIQYVLLQLAGILGVTALHNWISSYVRNMVVSIAVGFIGSMISSTLFFSYPETARFFIYSFPLYAAKNGTAASGDPLPALVGGIASALIILAAGCIEFQKRDIS
jgi:hypothetical protein